MLEKGAVPAGTRCGKKKEPILGESKRGLRVKTLRALRGSKKKKKRKKRGKKAHVES